MEDGQKAMLLWKLGPGDMNRALRGENPIPHKKTRATAESWDNLKPMPEKKGLLRMGLNIEDADMEIIRMGHIPEVMEDHWLMYCTEDTIRFHRSWSGECIYEAHYVKATEGKQGYVIDTVAVNLDCPDMPPFGPRAAGDLFMMLLAAEMGYGWYQFWEQFVESLEKGD